MPAAAGLLGLNGSRAHTHACEIYVYSESNALCVTTSQKIVRMLTAPGLVSVQVEGHIVNEQLVNNLGDRSAPK